MPAARPVQAVLFDLDDTLFDHQYVCRSGLASIQQQYVQLQHTPVAELEQQHYYLLESLHMEVLQGQRTMDSARIERFRRLFLHCGATIAVDQAEQIAAAYRQHYQAQRRALPGAIALLERLRETAKIAVVTNNLLLEQQEKLAACGLTQLVDLLVTSEELGVTKPHPAMFITALKRLSCAAADAVMVGDSWASDILGAQAVGMRAIWLNRLGVACPDPTIATEIRALEPLEPLLQLILQPEPAAVSAYK